MSSQKAECPPFSISRNHVEVRLSCGTAIRVEVDRIDVTIHGDLKPQVVDGALIVKKGTPIGVTGLEPWKESVAAMEWSDDLWRMVPEDLDAIIQLMTWAKLRWEGNRDGS